LGIIYPAANFGLKEIHIAIATVFFVAISLTRNHDEVIARRIGDKKAAGKGHYAGENKRLHHQ
jgi:hypothetical protein